MAKALHRVFHLCFGVMFLLILSGAVRQWPNNSTAALVLAVVLAFGLVLLVRKIAPALDGLSPGRFRLVFWGSALVLLAGLAGAGLLLDEIPIMDWAFVYQSLPDFLEHGFHLNPSNNGYYLVCNNNLGLALLLVGFYKPLSAFGILPGTGAGYAAGILFNVLMLWLGIVLACRAAKLALYRQSAPLLVLWFSLLFAPFYLWAPTFYSDTLCVPFLTGGLCCFLEWRRHCNPGWLAALGLLSFLGYAVKGSLGVLLIAAAIAALLEFGFHKKVLLSLAAMAAVFLLLMASYKLWQRHWLDYTDADAICYPTELWFCYGSHDLGDYSQQDVDDCNALVTVAQRRELLRRRIAENYASRGVKGNALFFYTKAARTWGNGWYDADEFLLNQLHVNFGSRFVIPGEPGFMPLTYYCQVLQYLLLLLVGLGGLLAAAPAAPPALFMPRLSLTGVVFFLSLWETKPRYAFHFAPVLLFCAVAALLAFASPQKVHARGKKSLLIG